MQNMCGREITSNKTKGLLAGSYIHLLSRSHFRQLLKCRSSLEKQWEPREYSRWRWRIKAKLSPQKWLNGSQVNNSWLNIDAFKHRWWSWNQDASNKIFLTTLSAIKQQDSKFWCTVGNIRKKRCFRRCSLFHDSSSSSPLKSLCLRLIHHPRLSSFQDLCSQPRETCSKVVIPVAKVGQRLSPAGWSRTQPQVCRGLTDVCLHSRDHGFHRGDSDCF